MNNIYIVTSKEISIQLKNMIAVFTLDNEYTILDNPSDIPDLTNKKILFALELNNIGYDKTVLDIISELFERGKNTLSGSIGAVLVHSQSDLFTKNAARNIIFLANTLGCSFIGHPVIEATGNLNNLLTWQKTINMPLSDICLELCRRLSVRFMESCIVRFDRPEIVALHASSRNTSNTLMLWNLVKENLKDCNIKELNVENGTIQDCIGCSFKTCIHYSKNNSCFYGGFMAEEIVPAIETANAIVFVCPNYNDAISANLTAVINRTTALYRKISFYDKYLFSIIVSGNSGSDLLAQQLIGALNINKGFRLPPNFSIMATANDPYAIKKVKNIKNLAKLFSNNLMHQIKNETHSI